MTMQKFHSFLFLTILAGLTACKSHEKKILIYASSEIQVDDSKQHITVSDGTTHHEQELDFGTGSPVTLDVQSPSGKTSVTANDDGFYILNLKNDTVIGSLRHVGADNGVPHYTQDQMKHILDSVQKLMAGLNVSEANRNYFVAPGKLVRISTETGAKVFGPYTSIPGSFDPSSVPEIFKFYTVPEERENVEKLLKNMN
jgi:hypothetical protein